MPWQLLSFGRPAAPARDTEAEVIADARRLKLASYDRVKREWYVAIPAEIVVPGAGSVFVGRKEQ